MSFFLSSRVKLNVIQGLFVKLHKSSQTFWNSPWICLDVKAVLARFLLLGSCCICSLGNSENEKMKKKKHQETGKQLKRKRKREDLDLGFEWRKERKKERNSSRKRQTERLIKSLVFPFVTQMRVPKTGTKKQLYTLCPWYKQWSFHWSVCMCVCTKVRVCICFFVSCPMQVYTKRKREWKRKREKGKKEREKKRTDTNHTVDQFTSCQLHSSFSGSSLYSSSSKMGGLSLLC